ncbi:phosphate butyryltransferase [candidate division GN15 bacterium]|nr:phosphate butyryltransferase [candidate division GN15 bacterium]
MSQEVNIPEVHSYSQILQRAKDKTREQRVRAALVDVSDINILKAFARAEAEGLIDAIVFGDKALFQKICDEHGIQFENVQMEHAFQRDLAVINAAKMAFDQKLDLIVKGRVFTADMLTVLFDLGSYFTSKEQCVSHVAVLKPERYDKLLLLSDSAVIVQPDLKTKLMMVRNLIDVAHLIGIDKPRVSVLAAVESVYPQMPVTTDAAVLSKMAERGQIKSCYLDGPLSFDISVDMFAAHAKGVVQSEVAGQADAMLAPHIEVANGIYKAMSLFGRCETGGVIVGGRVPIALGSRVDSAESKFNSIVLGVLAA